MQFYKLVWILWSQKYLLIIYVGNRPRVAIIREEGCNGDKEMAGAFWQAGFEPWDVAMTDIARKLITLDKFRGAAFVGGFSYADVLGMRILNMLRDINCLSDSAKGWAGAIRYNPTVFEQFEQFYNRKDTFSLGVCNGCQLMALLGWVPWRGLGVEVQPRFIHNESGRYQISKLGIKCFENIRYESRFTTVSISESPSIFLKGMAGSVLGVWTAHGEGKLFCKDPSIFCFLFPLITFDY